MLKRFLIFALPLVFASTSQAVIIGGAVTDIPSVGASDAFNQGGVFVELTLPFNPPNGAPNSVGNNTFQTPNLYGFNEGQNIMVPADVNVNIGATIPAGTVIASHYVFFDPGPTTSQQGFVDFDADILAVITSTSLLAASDFLLNNNVNYLNPAARGLEPGDSVMIGGAGEEFRLYVDWTASTPGDYVRVITAFSPGGVDPCATNPPGVGGCPAAVSEPAPYSLLLFAAIAAGLARRVGVTSRAEKAA